MIKFRSVQVSVKCFFKKKKGALTDPSLNPADAFLRIQYVAESFVYSCPVSQKYCICALIIRSMIDLWKENLRLAFHHYGPGNLG